MKFLSDMAALLPAWAPSWLPLLLLAPLVLFAFAFMAMPFSVFGIRGRLEGVEVRLDELHNEIRALSLRMPGAPSRGVDADDVYSERLRPATRESAVPPSMRPPIPPAPGDASWSGAPASRTDRGVRPTRAEPKFAPPD